MLRLLQVRSNFGISEYVFMSKPSKRFLVLIYFFIVFVFRMYVPESLWAEVKEGLVETQKSLKMGPATEADSFMSAVIDAKAFKRISGYIEHAKASPNCSIVAGGGYDDSVGFFVEPTIVQTTTPTEKIFQEEIFGPVVTVYVYPDKV